MNQLILPFAVDSTPEPNYKDRAINRLTEQDKAFHDWYRFVLSYPAHLVRDYIYDFGLEPNSTLLDPFCGTGTTIVEAKLNGIEGIGIEANPLAHFAASVKLKWDVDRTGLNRFVRLVADETLRHLSEQGIDDQLPFQGDLADLPLLTLHPDAAKLLIKNSISPLPLHKILVLRNCLNQYQLSPYYAHARLAFVKMLVFCASNVRFGPEIGVGKAKMDAPVVAPWLAVVAQMTEDLASVDGRVFPNCVVHHADARKLSALVAPASIDAVITSPPYPNEKDYTRTTRLESVILGFISNNAELRALKKSLLRSNTRGVYKGDTDDRWIANHEKISELAAQIEARRVELNKTSGFERLYGKVTKLYFGGMARHLAELRPLLKPGAKLAYVVGDQASYLRVLIRTGQLLGEIAEDLGYQVKRIDLFRTRAATATKSELREEVVILEWMG
ncbi:MAG: DNA methyltransferase [Caldilineaceae bacterium]